MYVSLEYVFGHNPPISCIVPYITHWCYLAHSIFYDYFWPLALQKMCGSPFRFTVTVILTPHQPNIVIFYNDIIKFQIS